MVVPSRIVEIVLVFLRVGATAFGGPAAHIALLEDEVVRRRRWVSRADFLDYLGATNLIPGPNSTEMAIHLGYARAGWPGLLAAGASFILPAALIVGAMAWAYVRYGTMPAMGAILYGVEPVVVAVVVQALWGLGRSAIKSAWLATLAAGSIAAAAFGVHELAILGGAAALAAVAMPRARHRVSSVAWPTGALGVAAPAAAAVAAPFGLWPMALIFLKIGSVLFGSGYVLLAFLRADFVERLGWLTERQILDAAAIGLVTPGPVFTTATFIGYLLGGASGAAVATIAIFLPAFTFVAATAPLLSRLRTSAIAAAILDGVNVASLALMAVVSWHLGRTAMVDAVTVGIAVITAILLFTRRVSSTPLILAGAIVGLLVRG